ncbi:hypothetical protein COO60DRAFT_823610 [Scenedesmus sp. NREL 46B-D3]|nr:hypothetical protein COO60DRAFT_823610 [Scenedesmus sp. NREL 46B-D3]
MHIQVFHTSRQPGWCRRLLFAVCCLLLALVLLEVQGPRLAACTQVIKGRRLQNLINSAVAADTSYLPSGSSSSSSSSSSSNSASSQPYLRAEATLAANTFTRTFRHPAATPMSASITGGWLCEKPVAARNIALTAIPTVPNLAPAAGTSASTPTTTLIVTPHNYFTGASSPKSASGAPVAPVVSSQHAVG